MIVAIAALTALVAGCGGGDDDGGDTTSSDGGGGAALASEPVLLSYHESIYWMPLLVAKDQGYFAEEGIEPEIEATEGSGFVTQQVIADNVDFGWAAAADDIIAFSKDENLRALMCNPPRNIFQITALKDSGITSVEDLDGKTLGTTEAGGGEEPVVDAALGSVGLTPGEDVTILPIGAAGPQSLDAIESGQVDAYASSYPDTSALRADGVELEDITPEEFSVVPADCLLVKKDVLEDEQLRDFAVKMARAWSKGAVFANANPKAAEKIACEMVPEECTNAAFARQYTLDTIELSGASDTSQPFGVVDLDAWETTADLLESSGTIEGPVDVSVLASGPEIEEFQDEYGDFDRAAIEAQAKEAKG